MDRIFVPGLGLLLSLSLAVAPLISYLRHSPASHTILAEESSNIIVHPGPMNQKNSFCDPFVDARHTRSRSVMLNCEIFPFTSYERLLNLDGVMP
jgi:hypothetical protein